MPAPAAATSASAACSELLVTLDTFDWETPYLPESDLAVIATPTLAAQLAAPTHMPPGMITEHVMITAQAKVEPLGSAEVVAVKPSGLPIQVWTCSASPNSAGHWLVTSLSPGVS